MLEVMVESRAHGAENGRRGGLLLGTFGLLAMTLASGWTYSLFAKQFALGAGEFDAAAMVAPVAMPEERPEPPAPPKPASNSAPASNSRITLRELVTRVAPTDNPPKNTLGEKNVVSAENFDLSRVRLGTRNSIPGDATGGLGNGEGRGSANGTGKTCSFCDSENGGGDADKDPAPVVKPKVEPKKPEPPRRPVSIGVANGIAEFLAKPPYPQAARQMQVQGVVNVQVTIDETGKVISASATDGHPLLRRAAVDAAYNCRFTPTKLSNVPVKVTGVIVYNFKL
jgi:TonB family protein